MNVYGTFRWATAEQDAMARTGDEDGTGNASQGRGASHHPPQVYAQQDAESELPAEFSHVKREVAEDKFHDMEERAKRQRVEQVEAPPQYYYDAQSAYAIYGYTAPDVAAAAAAYSSPSNQETTKKVAGIIPQNVLDNLKNLSKSEKEDTTKKAATTTTSDNNKSGLGNLAGYGSDSDEE